MKQQCKKTRTRHGFKSSIFLSIALVIALLSGCVVSLNPLYQEEDVLTDTRLEGKWLNIGEDNETWHFLPDKEKSYRLVHTEDTNRAEFKVHLLKLNGNYFINLYPEKLSIDNSLYDMHFVRVHSFFRVDFQEKHLALYMFDIDWMKNVQDSANIKLDIQMKEEDYALITSDTDELQKFVKEFVTDTASFEDPILLKKID
ncbi:MAG: hypothetical protein R6U66_03285 [Bacteroidales bacterium]